MRPEARDAHPSGCSPRTATAPPRLAAGPRPRSRVPDRGLTGSHTTPNVSSLLPPATARRASPARGASRTLLLVAGGQGDMDALFLQLVPNPLEPLVSRERDRARV